MRFLYILGRSGLLVTPATSLWAVMVHTPKKVPATKKPEKDTKNLVELDVLCTLNRFDINCHYLDFPAPLLETVFKLVASMT